MRIILALNGGLTSQAQAHLLSVVGHLINGGGAPQDGSEIPLRMWVRGAEKEVGSAFIIGDKKEAG